MEIVDIDRLIEMCWEDRTPFEAIEFQFGLKEEGKSQFWRKSKGKNIHFSGRICPLGLFFGLVIFRIRIVYEVLHISGPYASV